MPVVPLNSPLLTLVERATVNSSLPSQAVNSTIKPTAVVCAWPVSGQYGPGSRILYYVLVAACVLARKSPWLRDACLAAALLFPAVAAIHGIVLAAMHTNGAVDMDIYGAFQLCSIGILTAPPTVRLSKTYWNQVHGRNVIFIWTSLILAGLLSLTVEFYRTTSSPCKGLAPGAKFPYGVDNACGLTCSVDDGPFSRLRQGSANNIYVIPEPRRITFGMGTLFAAACCVPAVLSIVSIYNKIVETKQKKKRQGTTPGETPEVSPEMIDRTNKIIRSLLSVVEIPVFAGAVLALVILGEINFWSTQVNYMTERIAAVGQWAPIAGTGLAVVGALLLRITETWQQDSSSSDHHSSHMEEKRRPTIEIHPDEETVVGARDLQIVDSNAIEEEPVSTPKPAHMKPETDHLEDPLHSSSSETSEQIHRVESKKDAGRGKFASLVTKMTGSEAFDRDQSSFQAAKKTLPEIPAERLRNARWTEQEQRFGLHRSSFGNSATPSLYGESNPSVSRDPSPYPSPGHPRSASTLPTPSSPSRTYNIGTTDARLPYRQRDRAPSEPYGPSGSTPLTRSATLQVPPSPRR